MQQHSIQQSKKLEDGVGFYFLAKVYPVTTKHKVFDCQWENTDNSREESLEDLRCRTCRILQLIAPCVCAKAQCV